MNPQNTFQLEDLRGRYIFSFNEIFHLNLANIQKSANPKFQFLPLCKCESAKIQRLLILNLQRCSNHSPKYLPATNQIQFFVKDLIEETTQVSNLHRLFLAFTVMWHRYHICAGNQLTSVQHYHLFSCKTFCIESFFFSPCAQTCEIEPLRSRFFFIFARVHVLQSAKVWWAVSSQKSSVGQKFHLLQILTRAKFCQNPNFKYCLCRVSATSDVVISTDQYLSTKPNMNFVMIYFHFKDTIYDTISYLTLCFRYWKVSKIIQSLNFKQTKNSWCCLILGQAWVFIG